MLTSTLKDKESESKETLNIYIKVIYTQYEHQNLAKINCSYTLS